MRKNEEDPDPLEQAGQAINELTNSYRDWTRDQIAEMRRLLAPFEDGAHPPDPASLDLLHGLAHNIKGTGSSFDYPLSTEVGQLLCRYLHRLDHSHRASVPLLLAHVQALELILTHHITGTGGETGTRLTARLNRLADMALSEKA